MNVQPYLLNVALHAAILSASASLCLLLMRQERYRSLVAITGLLAVGFLPWFSALSRSSERSVVSSEIVDQPMALPTWTVVTLSANPADSPPAAAPLPATEQA